MCEVIRLCMQHQAMLGVGFRWATVDGRGLAGGALVLPSLCNGISLNR